MQYGIEAWTLKIGGWRRAPLTSSLAEVITAGKTATAGNHLLTVKISNQIANMTAVVVGSTGLVVIPQQSQRHR
jgi:hypothetical protein